MSGGALPADIGAVILGELGAFAYSYNRDDFANTSKGVVEADV